ncbi:SAM-dependent methyltransferase TehB [Chimaeribacter arupi]|uniref:SAM-dependent methyltransferase TehB n=2 Tax=Yersiniaceae TaxID=1903411 RepID=A0A2N5EI95_9GAMM|nr:MULTISPECIES: SAM-dependent methyltransferase TehB [Yersiniaceae]MBS0969319.1 SAM-dependent methyltransferase TehB [Nissabacter archeti]PLR42415.1 SAM-dependent methyltransferase TehB [Chimaeribacter arupi]PLR44356.1 SAM-dependent methyltransferase TehB [Chimaeribacter arupi]PLR44511.1 SAM-dependent methyltransferase TehB [Chimaeribacter arupi]
MHDVICDTTPTSDDTLVCYKTLPVWHHDTLPTAFQQPHNTQPGTWAQLTILNGTLEFALLTEQGDVTQRFTFDRDHQPPRIAPQQWHRIVAFSPDIACRLAFYCEPAAYYHKKYQLTLPHSEVIEAAGIIPPGRALDVGCGNGRNVLYLQQQGFTVEGWDKHAESLASLNTIVSVEGLSGITTAQHDLNGAVITGHYAFILSTVVMMFLQPESIAPLLQQMQQATVPGGYNLIVAAMDSEDYPCVMPFPFTFRTGELRDAYAGWEILKYNENPGALHKTNAQGERIKMRFATLLARKGRG